MTITETCNQKKLADRESALRTIDREIETISKLKDSVALDNLSLALDIMQS